MSDERHKPGYTVQICQFSGPFIYHFSASLGLFFCFPKVGSLIRVDRNEKLAILHHNNYSVTPRVLKLQRIP